ncbi:ATP-dependent DNA ligase [Microbacterium protaetiae]|uniref:ATP-dependent DNA ligase n=1 Tax=Microbacterium protaetiae TaxID=2509458 RepID=A0A4P6EG60_9MICO|nr:ATP-dependent DNA ligase [Microbacterium protaetiae]QAY61392.1 ATP-dependent DNA ligase [Microbacterium protaetiae]
MGKFIYQESVSVEIEDRALAHLQVVILDKLRRAESFAFSWREDTSIGDGRTTVWVNAASALVFKYHGSRSPQLDPDWLEALASVANSPSGLRLVPQPGPANGTNA